MRCWEKTGIGLVVALSSGIGIADVEVAVLVVRLDSETILTGYVGYDSCC